MKLISKWIIRTLVVFLILCAISYHNDMDVDGDLHLGFPKEIYHKAPRVLIVATGQIGSTEGFYPMNLLIDILFGFIVALILFFAYKKLFRKKINNRDKN